MMKNTAVKMVGGVAAAVLAVSGISYAWATSSHQNEHPAYSAASQVKSPNAAEQVLLKNLAQLKQQETQERQEVASRFSLPSGGSFGDRAKFAEVNDQLKEIKALKESRSADQTFKPTTLKVEAGSFKSSALVQWQCAWLKDAVLAQESGNTVKRDADVQTLVNFKQAPESSMFPDYDAFLQDNVYPLSKGDSSNAREFINNGFSCVKVNQLPEK